MTLDYLDKEEKYLIRCPVCGQEYLPAELFLPVDFLGNPKEIIKTNSGKIDFYLGERPTYETEYTCDNCGTLFKVNAKVNFETTVEESENYSTEYVSKLKRNIIFGEVDLFNEDSTTQE